jgi:hypothetical protein
MNLLCSGNFVRCRYGGDGEQGRGGVAKQPRAGPKLPSYRHPGEQGMTLQSLIGISLVSSSTHLLPSF